MITKKDILSMVHHVNRRSRGGFDHRLVHPKRDWLIGLIIFILIVIIGGAYNIYHYQKFSNFEADIVEPESTIARYNERAVSDALQFYRERDQLYEARLIEGSSLAPVITGESDAADEVANDLSSTTAAIGTQTLESSATTTPIVETTASSSQTEFLAP